MTLSGYTVSFKNFSILDRANGEFGSLIFLVIIYEIDLNLFPNSCLFPKSSFDFVPGELIQHPYFVPVLENLEP